MTDDERAARLEFIDEILTEAARVWKRNPGKSFMALASRVSRNSDAFSPFEVTDTHVLTTLRSIAPGSQ